jgi:3-oxoacyl-[acyl-carrier protein] reductase
VPVALVTGASKGIGAACALALAEAGHDVGIGFANDAEGAESTAQAVRNLGRSAVVHQADVSDEDEAAGLVSAVEDALGPLDALILNAGITRDGPALRMGAADWGAVIDTNLSGAFYTVRPALRGMLRRRAGSIVAISSVVGLSGNIGQANYSAAKAGMIGMVKSLAREAAPRGVRVNAVAPGYITTDMTAGIPEQFREQILEHTPLGRFGTPEDVAAAVRFLCSEDAGFMTGAVLSVDGGMAIGA